MTHWNNCCVRVFLCSEWHRCQALYKILLFLFTLNASHWSWWKGSLFFPTTRFAFWQSLNQIFTSFHMSIWSVLYPPASTGTFTIPDLIVCVLSLSPHANFPPLCFHCVALRHVFVLISLQSSRVYFSRLFMESHTDPVTLSSTVQYTPPVLVLN